MYDEMEQRDYDYREGRGRSNRGENYRGGDYREDYREDYRDYRDYRDEYGRNQRRGRSNRMYRDRYGRNYRSNEEYRECLEDMLEDTMELARDYEDVSEMATNTGDKSKLMKMAEREKEHHRYIKEMLEKGM